jgi:membrane associated rhomboid family serine protease
MFPVCDVIPPKARPYVTIALVAACSAAFLYALQLDRAQMFELAHALGIVPADLAWHSLLTATLLHDGWIHFGGNMLCLWIFGGNVEDAMGHGTYLLFCVAAAAVAGLAYVVLQPDSGAPLVGASGAVAAVMGAYFVLYPRSRVLTAVFLVLHFDVIEVPAVFFLGAWLMLQLITGLASMGAGAADAGVAFGGHVAGFTAGAAAGLAFRGRVRAG